MPGPRHTIGLMSSLPRRVAHVLCLLLIVAVPGAAGAQKPVVAAASDLSFALVEISERFTTETGQQVELVFGSSGTLARQIRDGAPFEIFLSADESFVQQLQTAGLTRDGGALYAVGRIVLFAPAGSPMRPDDGLAGLGRLLAAGKVTRFAIANPQHAPYGRAAEAALRKAGLWADLQPKLVLGDNVSQAAQFATTGDAVGGLIAYSLALAPTLTARGTYALIPDTDHPPLRQRMVVLKRAGPAAGRFYEYLQGAPARAIFQRFGFVLPQ
jgi:molybdate transport system substrate-binding protein